MAFCTKCGAQVPPGAAFCPACGSPVSTAASGQQVPVSGVVVLTRDAKAQEYWVNRLLAYVVDAIIVYAIIGLIVAATAIPTFLAGIFIPGYSPNIPVFGAFLGPFAGFILVLYFTFAESIYGKTIGKSIWRLHVTTSSGGRPNLGASFLRNLSKINWVLLLLDVILGLAFGVEYTKKLSDRFLGTTVSHY